MYSMYLNSTEFLLHKVKFLRNKSAKFVWPKSVSPVNLRNRKIFDLFTTNFYFIKGSVSKKRRFWSLLIFYLSVVSIRRKLLKTTHTEERSVHTNSERCNIQLGSLTNQFNSKQIIQILQTIVIDYFSTHS